MKPPVEFKIGIIAPQTGAFRTLGLGVANSVRFVLERCRPDLAERGVSVALQVYDDFGEPSVTLNMIQRCYDTDSFCIIGPCTSACTAAVLIEGTKPEFPIVSPAATATGLTRMGAANFFRATTPDIVRADLLVRAIKSRYPNQTVHVYPAEESHPYFKTLATDVIHMLGKYQCNWKYLAPPYQHLNSPVIFCCPSGETIRIATDLLHLGVSASVFFTFGSNTELLRHELVGTITVSDLDRVCPNPAITETLRSFEQQYGRNGDPSLAAMNCATMLSAFIGAEVSSTPNISPTELRSNFLEAMRNRSNPMPGLFGDVAFKSNGEMVNPENLAVLKMASNRDGPHFVHSDEQSPAKGAGAKLILFPLHGIRTKAEWLNPLVDIAQACNWVCRREKWYYGRFSLLQFLSPFARKAKIHWFRQTYDDEVSSRNVELGPNEYPSIIAHSFGTYILGNALLRYSYLRVNRVILCGSILRRDFPWDALIERGQVQAVRNEFGVRDIWARRVSLFVPGTGGSGTLGFSRCHPRLEQTKFDYDHSEYFEKGHIRANWVPFLKKQQLFLNEKDVQLPDMKPIYPWGLWGLYVLTAAAAAGLLMWYFGSNISSTAM